MRLPRTADVGAWPVAPSSLLGLFSSTAGCRRQGTAVPRQDPAQGVGSGLRVLLGDTHCSSQLNCHVRDTRSPDLGTGGARKSRSRGPETEDSRDCSASPAAPPRLSLGRRAPLKWPCPDQGCRAGAGLGGPRLRPAAATFGAASGLHRYRPSSCFPIFLITNDSSDAVIYQTRPSPDV